MAPRIRTIKPSFWDSEKLGGMSLLARLTFVGLFSLADDEGRGRGSDKFLMMRIHGYAPDVKLEDLADTLLKLEELGYVRFYAAAGCRYYYLPGFKDHQRIDKPSRSELPAPPADEGRLPFADDSKSFPGRLEEASQGEGKGGDGKGQEESTARPAPGAQEPSPFGPEGLRMLWNERKPAELAAVAKMTASRTAKARARLREHPEESYWSSVFAAMSESKFLRGLSGRGWRASFDWVIRSEDSATKVLEGAYKDGAPAGVGAAAPRRSKYAS